MRNLRNALLAALLVLLAVGPTASAAEAIFDQIVADKVVTTDLAVERTSIFSGTMYARAILSPTIDQLWNEVERLNADNDYLLNRVDMLTERVMNLERRLACVENKPNQVKPVCRSS